MKVLTAMLHANMRAYCTGRTGAAAVTAAVNPLSCFMSVWLWVLTLSSHSFEQWPGSDYGLLAFLRELGAWFIKPNKLSLAGHRQGASVNQQSHFQSMTELSKLATALQAASKY